MRFLLGPILLIGLLCLSTSIVSGREEDYYDDYFYEAGEDVPDQKYQPAPPTTTTTTTTTTTQSTTTQSTTTLPTTTTTTLSTTTTKSTTEYAEPIKPIEDNFNQVINEKKIEIIKKPYDEEDSDLVYDDSSDYNEDTYDEGNYEEKENFNENIVTKLVTTRPEDYEDYEEQDSSEEQHNEVQDGAKHNLANAANVRAGDNVKSEKFKFNLNMVYVIVPIASLVLVVLVVGTVLVLAKKTNVFNRKSQGSSPSTNPVRKQIYKSVAQQDPAV